MSRADSSTFSWASSVFFLLVGSVEPCTREPLLFFSHTDEKVKKDKGKRMRCCGDARPRCVFVCACKGIPVHKRPRWTLGWPFFPLNSCSSFSPSFPPPVCVCLCCACLLGQLQATLLENASIILSFGHISLDLAFPKTLCPSAAAAAAASTSPAAIPFRHPLL